MPKTTTSTEILQLIKNLKEVGPTEISKQIGITPQATHRQLLKLQQKGLISKIGSPPKVFYSIASEQTKSSASSFSDQTIEENFLYVSPKGDFLSGAIGFETWAKSTNPKQALNSLIDEYKKVLFEAEIFRNSIGLIDATERIKSIDKESVIKKVYYQDFYSLPKFGKTKLGSLVLHGKQSQNLKLIRSIAAEVNEKVSRLIKDEKLSAIIGIPHSIPRIVQFVDEILKFNRYFNLPHLKLVKSYSSGIPIAQKSLSKLEERISNARSTIIVPSNLPRFKSILLFDDAIGSGATLNETAKKLKSQLGVEKIIGFAIVGSYKGFEVIREV